MPRVVGSGYASPDKCSTPTSETVVVRGVFATGFGASGGACPSFAGFASLESEPGRSVSCANADEVTESRSPSARAVLERQRAEGGHNMGGVYGFSVTPWAEDYCTGSVSRSVRSAAFELGPTMMV